MTGPDPGVISRLREASRELSLFSDEELVTLLGKVLDSMGKEFLDRSARELAEHTGSSPGMTRFGLDRALGAHHGEALTRWLAEARSEANIPLENTSPRVVVQILAGNVPGLALPAILEALLARCAVILKPASGDPVLPQLLMEQFSRVEPRLGNAVAVQNWKGGDAVREAPLFDAVDGIVAAGGGDLMADLPSRVDVPLFLRGPRVSVAVLGSTLTRPRGFWDDLVRETVLWEQRGCLSPVIVFTADPPQAVAGLLAESFRRWEELWPVAPRTLGEAAAIAAYRSRYEIADPSRAGLHASLRTEWTVVWDQVAALDHGPSPRVLRVAPLPSAGELESRFRGARNRIQGVGTAGLDTDFMEALGRSGVPYVTSVEGLQDPPAGWRADGRSALKELLQLHQANH